MTQYNIISLPAYAMKQEAEFVEQFDHYTMALTKVIVYAEGRTLEPIATPMAVAALHRYTPLQAWVVRDEDGNKLGLVAIQEAEVENHAN